MKTTIKLDLVSAITVQPSRQGVLVNLCTGPVPVISKYITKDQAEALIFGLEQCLVPGVRCHDSNACAAGQLACPSPSACGVTL